MATRSGRALTTVPCVVRVIAAAVGFAACVWSLVTWQPYSLSTACAFAVALSAVWLVSMRLPRGGVVNIDVSLGMAAAVLLPPQVAVLSSVSGAFLGGLADRRNARGVRAVLADAAARPIPVLGTALAYTALGSPSPVDHRTAFVGATVLVGVVYLALDALVVLFGRGASHESVLEAFRPLGTLYLGHVSIGVVLCLLYPWIGLAALLILTLLVLVMQNSYSMYLRTRIAYQETIGVLALASELQTPASSGHAQRVADAAVATGKRMGLHSHLLETLNYAALLHDIGRIGADSDVCPHSPLDGHPRIGAEMVEGIPFLEHALPAILHHHDFHEFSDELGADQLVASCVVGLCCEYDHLQMDGMCVDEALECLAAMHVDAMSSRVLSALQRRPVDSKASRIASLAGTVSE